MEQGPSNAERLARQIYGEKVRLALATETISAARPPICAPESMVTVKVEGVERSAKVVEEEAGVYLIKIMYPNGAFEWGSCLEEEILEKLN